MVSMCCTTEFAFAQNSGPSGRSTATPRYVRRDGSFATDPQAAFSPSTRPISSISTCIDR